MVVDSSAVISILRREPDGAAFFRRIESESRPVMSAATRLEAHIVAQRRFGEDSVHVLDRYFMATRIQIVSFDRDQLDAARFAFSAYGRGRHPAGLNFGDCFSYALAKTRGEPLLFKGTDFQLTDIAPAL